jgi:hypothetical protein
MATRDGYEIAKELVEKHGWAWEEVPAAVDPADAVFADRWVVDPLTGSLHGPHDARRIQEQRSGRVQSPGEIAEHIVESFAERAAVSCWGCDHVHYKGADEILAELVADAIRRERSRQP